jgi:hypothetical protein
MFSFLYINSATGMLCKAKPDRLHYSRLSSVSQKDILAS